MEAKELRILNYVNTPYEKEVEIKSIVEDDNWGGYYIVTNNNKTSITVVKPIPLTEQWLLDFGFVSHKQNYYKKDYFRIMIYEGIFFLEDWHDGCLEIEHVHRLQNLYFALNNNELIRKL